MAWHEKISKYCNKYNIPLYFLSDTLDEPKVIPMIRGKAFEFTVYEKLKTILDKNVWKVEKPNLNAQLGFHDVDVEIIHIATGKKISVECKLAAKGTCRVKKDTTEIRVKCMRSRTLGDEMVKKLSPSLKVTSGQLKIHNDQYMENNFDFVVTSISNAFYQTDSNGTFVFAPTENQRRFLDNFKSGNLKDKTFNSLYIACSKNISVKTKNKVVCTRKKCKKTKNCGFIPNYPIIKFKTNSLEPTNGWSKIESVKKDFLEFLKL